MLVLSFIESPTANSSLDSQLNPMEPSADELLDDIQKAVDEMLQDFESPSAPKSEIPSAPKSDPSKRIHPAQTQTQLTEHSILIKSRNGGFGFQVMGGADSDLPAQVDYIVPGDLAMILSNMYTYTACHKHGMYCACMLLAVLSPFPSTCYYFTVSPMKHILLTDSPADQSGLEVEDTLVHVNGENVQQYSHSHIVSLLKQVFSHSLL